MQADAAKVAPTPDELRDAFTDEYGDPTPVTEAEWEWNENREADRAAVAYREVSERACVVRKAAFVLIKGRMNALFGGWGGCRVTLHTPDPLAFDPLHRGLSTPPVVVVTVNGSGPDGIYRVPARVKDMVERMAGEWGFHVFYRTPFSPRFPGGPMPDAVAYPATGSVLRRLRGLVSWGS